MILYSTLKNVCCCYNGKMTYDNTLESNLSLVYIAYDSSVAPLGRGQCVVFVWLTE